MSDLTRSEVIKHLEFLKLAGQINAKPEKINPDYLQFAIDSLKTDEAYNLMYEKVDFIEIPEGATNGDMIQAMFPNIQPKVVGYIEYIGDEEVHGREVVLSDRVCFDDDWWNSPYRKEQE